MCQILGGGLKDGRGSVEIGERCQSKSIEIAGQRSKDIIRNDMEAPKKKTSKWRP